MSTILITGCRGGFGRAAAERLLKRGHSVIATVHHQQDVKPLRRALAHFGARASVEKLDITDPADRLRAAELDPDVLVNNAATGDSGPLLEIPPERLRTVFETNVFATLALTQAVAQRMARRGDGRVVFIGSMAGFIPMPYLAPYGMTKYALEGMAGALRRELRPLGVRVVMINPGAFDTGFNQRNMDRKYEWLDVSRSHYRHLLPVIRRYERLLRWLEAQRFGAVARSVVRAVEAARPRRRYVTPRWAWWGLPLARWLA